LLELLVRVASQEGRKKMPAKKSAKKSKKLRARPVAKVKTLSKFLMPTKI